MFYNKSVLISQIYHKYQIPKNLQRHMLEVAAVASFLADNVKKGKVDKKRIVEWSLLHDMGNIVKFKDFISPHMRMGEDYWRKVQKKFIEKYGSDAHLATISIIKEINPKNETTILELINSCDFKAIMKNGYPNIETRICDYADMSVAPSGIVGFEKRVADLIKRYKLKKDDFSTKRRKENLKIVSELISINLADIVKQDYTKRMKELSEYDILLKV